MIEMHVNLKRFDVPTRLGGIGPSDKPVEWITEAMIGVVKETGSLGSDLNVVIYPPESLLAPAVAAVEAAGGGISIGSQGVFTADVEKGGNFGAFTTSLPAAAAVTYGCSYALVGHSEERLKLFSFLASYDPHITQDEAARLRATQTVNAAVVASAARAHAAGLKVTVCVGETAEERGNGTIDFDRIGTVLRAQIEGLRGSVPADKLIIAYEPRWAIGPGKTPPDPDYISEIATRITSISRDMFGEAVPVLYGGGLKAENAGPIGAVPNVDGGLIALTKFTPPIAFDPGEMARITEFFMAAKKD